MNTQSPYWRSNYLRVAAMVALCIIVVHLGQALALSNGLSIPTFVSDGLTVLANGLVIVPLLIAAQDSSAQGKYVRAGWLCPSRWQSARFA